MEELLKTIEVNATAFIKDANAQATAGNKAAGLRARKMALELMAQLKEFRKLSIEKEKQ